MQRWSLWFSKTFTNMSFSATVNSSASISSWNLFSFHLLLLAFQKMATKIIFPEWSNSARKLVGVYFAKCIFCKCILHSSLLANTSSQLCGFIFLSASTRLLALLDLANFSSSPSTSPPPSSPSYFFLARNAYLPNGKCVTTTRWTNFDTCILERKMNFQR